MSQANPNITALHAQRREASARPHRQHNRRHAWPAILRCNAPPAGLGFVILVLLYLSLNHLARGIAVVTLCAEWEGLAMAVGLDLLIVALELAMVVTARTKAARPVARFANPALITAFAWSASLNGFAFSANQDAVPWKAVAALLGLSIPILIYLGTRTWAALTIESRRAARGRRVAPSESKWRTTDLPTKPARPSAAPTRLGSALRPCRADPHRPGGPHPRHHPTAPAGLIFFGKMDEGGDLDFDRSVPRGAAALARHWPRIRNGSAIQGASLPHTEQADGQRRHRAFCGPRK
jgi:hypothetical protein